MQAGLTPMRLVTESPSAAAFADQRPQHESALRLLADTQTKGIVKFRIACDEQPTD